MSSKHRSTSELAGLRLPVLAEPVTIGLTGLNGRAVRWIVADGLAAAVSDMPAEEFGEVALNEGVRNMAWLGPRAVAQQEVNARLHQAAEAMISLAFGTVFRDDDPVRELLRARGTELGERLARVRGSADGWWPSTSCVNLGLSLWRKRVRQFEPYARKSSRARLAEPIYCAAGWRTGARGRLAVHSR